MEQDTMLRRANLKREVDALRDRFRMLHQHERELLERIEAMEVLAERLSNRAYKVRLTDVYTAVVRSGTTLASAHLDTMIPPTAYEGGPTLPQLEQEDEKKER